MLFATDTGAKKILEYSANSSSPVGTNLIRISDYSPDMVFLDAFKSSRPWITRDNSTWTWDTGEEEYLDLDAQGWVRSLPGPSSSLNFDAVATLIFRSLVGLYPAGQYVVLYEGEGTIEYGFDAVKNQSESAHGRDVLEVTPSEQGIFLQITATDPNGTGDYIRNIRVISPGYESTYQTEIFNPAFIDVIQKYRVLRFMDWMETNETTQSSWIDRPRLDDVRWTNREGVPVEMMVTLSNRVNADPWFTMPHMADNNYISQFAAIVRDNLDPNLRVYVEYSNEVWNSGFPQAGWVEDQALAEWPGGTESNFTKRLNWYGKRTAEICDIWETVWGAESYRVICVMGAQAANPWTANTALDCSLWDGAPCQAHHVDAVAIAPYFGGYLGQVGNEAAVQNWINDPDGGLDRLFTEIFSGGQLPGGPTGGSLEQASGWIANYASLAETRGLALTAYEGGQHLVGVGSVTNNNAITNLFTTANRDPRMGTAYEQYLDSWKSFGGELFVHFTSTSQYTKYGSWGAIEILEQPNTPKYLALMGFIDGNPCWWPDCESGTSLEVPLPPILTASDGEYNFVEITWDSVGGAEDYQIFRDTDPGGSAMSQIGTTSSLFFHDAAADDLQVYYYWGKACNSAGCSPASDPDSGFADYTATGTLFWDDFETGNFSRWSRFNDGGGWLYACSQAAINGSWGACVERGTNDRRKQLIDETAVNQTTFHTRFSFDTNGLSMLDGQRFRFMQTKMLTVRPYYMVMRYSLGEYLVQLAVRTDAGAYTKTGWFTLSEAPHTIEVDWMAATGPAANDGYGELWIDGAMIDSVTGVDNDTMYVDTFKIGFTSRLEGKSISGIFYLDDIATSNTGYIGLP